MDQEILSRISPVGVGHIRALKAHGRVLSEAVDPLPPGTRLDAAALARLSGAGLLRAGLFLPVYHPVRCAVLCLAQEAACAAVLTGALREQGFEAARLQPPTADDPDALADVLWLAAENTDLYLVAGGGDLLEDAVPLLELEPILAEDGTAVYDYRRRPVIALPAAPEALCDAFSRTALPVLRRRAGMETVKKRIF